MDHDVAETTLAATVASNADTTEHDGASSRANDDYPRGGQAAAVRVRATAVHHHRPGARFTRHALEAGAGVAVD